MNPLSDPTRLEIIDFLQDEEKCVCEIAIHFKVIQPVKESIIAVIIGSSSHFEIAIAVSIYGLGSQAALGTTMGLFWEVPVMLSLVYLGKKLWKRGFWKNN